jgi:hypothetical protein
MHMALFVVQLLLVEDIVGRFAVVTADTLDLRLATNAAGPTILLEIAKPKR